MNLTIIILAHNEEKTIKKHVEDIKRKIISLSELKKWKFNKKSIFHESKKYYSP